jgi:hypothetical protein
MTYVAVGMVFLNGLSGIWFTLGRSTPRPEWPPGSLLY